MTGRRSRRGCWTCRQRRRKCDETKPTCLSCHDRGLSCGGYELRLADFRAFGSFDGQMSCRITRGSLPSGPSTHRLKRKSRKAERNEQQSSTRRPPRKLLAKINPNVATEASPGLLNSEPQVTDAQPLISTTPHDQGFEPTSTNATGSQPEFTLNALPPDNNPDVEYSSPHLFDYPAIIASDGELDLPLEPDLSRNTNSTSKSADEGCLAQVSVDSLPTPDLRGSFALDSIPHLSLAYSDCMELSISPSQLWDANAENAEDFTSHAGLEMVCTTEFHEAIEEETLSRSLVRTSRSQSPALYPIQQLCHQITIGHGPDMTSDEYLLQHFLTVLAPKFCPAHPDHNPYKTVYGTLASIFKPLRHTLLRASALHLNQTGELPLDAMACLQDDLPRSPRNEQTLLPQRVPMAATLMLSILCEIIGPSSFGWTSKLVKARNLLTDTAESFSRDEYGAEMQFLRLHFNWMVAISWSLRSKQIPGNEIQQLDFIEDDQNPTPVAGDHERWFSNLPDSRLFAIFKAATRLSQRLYGEMKQNPWIAQQLMPDVADLVLQAKLWSPKPFAGTEPSTSYASMVNNVWRNGILCYIYSDICALPSTDARIQECVQLGSQSLEGLPWIQHVLWPAVMTAVHAISEPHRKIYTVSFADMGLNLYFFQAMSVLDFLGRVWADLDACDTKPCCWQSVLHKSGMRVNIFL